MKRLCFLLLLVIFPGSVFAQVPSPKDFKGTADSLNVHLEEHFNVRSRVDVWKVMRRGNVLDIYFDRNLSDYPWRGEDLGWMRSRLEEFWPENLQSYKPGRLFCRSIELDDLPTPGPGNGSGKPQDYKYNYRSHRTGNAFVEPLVKNHPSKGLYRRNIALWQSHGLYFDGSFWNWQRTPLFRTIEDLYTQSYVLPFLIPMLENAGAYVLTPRERDTQIHEVICDNDPHYAAETTASTCDWASAFEEPLPSRRHGKYREKGSWSSLEGGFADKWHILSGEDNPFSAGTARQAATVRGAATAEARWMPDIPERGRYAVYVSYKSIEGSTKSAHYTVRHLGGSSEFAVDQTHGGGTWIYLGTFEFDKGSEQSCVILDNSIPKGHEGGKFVTADAVRFGGGIGKVLRGEGSVADSTWTVSGMPSYTEGALYWMQWAGAPQSLWKQWDGDYTRDYAGRGAWVKWMKDELGVPVDLSLAFHSDAGVAPGDTTVGTLAIYTLLEKGSRKFSGGQDRMASRFLGDCIQTELTDMIRRNYDSTWRRRQLWDRSYSECRTTDVPGIILEILSHQNFADMKYGLDPQFRFDVSRSVYKGMLKFLSSYYGSSYAVQPLPVKDFRVKIEGDALRLSWSPVEDPLEPTAKPTYYTVYTRTDGGGWDAGRSVRDTTTTTALPEGKVLSFRVTACNDGGASFPSEILSAGRPSAGTGRTAAPAKSKVLIVNNFTRISGPAFFDYPEYAGFDDALDGGVPWGTEINFIGEDYEHRRDKAYSGNNAPGFGGSDYWFAGRTYEGNSFDYPAAHGKALLELGYSFESCSAGAFAGADHDAGIIDLICGKQVSTITGSGEHGVRFQVFPEEIRESIAKASGRGVSLIVSGADIATEGWDSVYRLPDNDAISDYRRAVRDFCREVLGIKWISSRASRDGIVLPISGGRPMEFWNLKNSRCYCVENPDGIRPNDKNGKVVYKYRSSNVGAGVFYKGDGYRAATFGFPLETLKSGEDLRDILSASLSFISE